MQCRRAALNQLFTEPGHNLGAEIFERVIIIKVF